MIGLTGATGLVGRWVLTELLAQGVRVRLIARPEAARAELQEFLAVRGWGGAEAAGQIHWQTASLEDGASLEDAVRGCHRVIHCAAWVSFHHRDAAKMYRINREGTGHLVNAMLHEGVLELVHVSSVAALGRSPEGVTDEESPFEDGPGVSHYARSKFGAELEAWRGQEEGLRVVVLNPGVILGAGDFGRSSAALFDRVHRGLPFYPLGSNGYVAVQDVARAAHLLPASGAWGERFILVSEQVPHRTVLNQLAHALGRPAPRYALPPWLAGALWRWGWVQERMLGMRTWMTREGLANTHRNFTYRTDKLPQWFAARGIEWQYTPLSEAIQDAAQAYRAARVR
jgi:nucleoside-diphosphate-sugar epimerase